MSIYDELADMLEDSISAQLGILSGSGKWTTDGSAAAVIPCRMEGTIKQIKDFNGREVVSEVQALTVSNNNLDVRLHRFTLPARYKPRVNVQAKSITPESDDEGNIHEEVLF